MSDDILSKYKPGTPQYKAMQQVLAAASGNKEAAEEHSTFDPLASLIQDPPEGQPVDRPAGSADSPKTPATPFQLSALAKSNGTGKAKGPTTTQPHAVGVTSIALSDGDASQSLAEEVLRLAKLPLPDYDKERTSISKKFNCRLATLDELVEQARPKQDDGLQGKESDIKDSEPWPEPVNGAALLNEIAATIKRYMFLQSDSEAELIALWCAHTHIFSKFSQTPYLHITSPGGGSGKSTLKDIIGFCVNKPASLAHATIAVVFRLAEEFSPTMLLDEVDKWITAENKELGGALNAGYQKNCPYPRCEGDNNEVRWFNTFGPKAFFGIGMLSHSNLSERALRIQLKKIDSKKPEEKRELCKEAAKQAIKQLSYDRKLARWLRDNADKLSVEPPMPESLDPRLEDNWRPLFAVAQLAGEDWPERVLKALRKLYRPDQDPKDQRVQLLGDLRSLVEEARRDNQEWLLTEDMIEHLISNPELPWSEACKGFRPINDKFLSYRLAPIRPGKLPGGKARGYRVAELLDDISRYVPEPFKRDEPVDQPEGEDEPDVDI